MQEVRFEIIKSPVPAARPRVTPRGTYYPKAHTDYKKFLDAELKNMPGLPATGVVVVKMLFVMPRYKTSDYPTSRCDVDNLSKLPLDCMSKSYDDVEETSHRYWYDDSLLVDLRSLKRFVRPGESPNTKVRIAILDTDISDYVDRAFEAPFDA